MRSIGAKFRMIQKNDQDVVLLCTPTVEEFMKVTGRMTKGKDPAMRYSLMVINIMATIVGAKHRDKES